MQHLCLGAVACEEEHDGLRFVLTPGAKGEGSRDTAALSGKGCMFQIRIHGRGGQGVVTGAEMLSVAAFQEDRHAQAFPSLGSERTGAPVVAFCRIASEEIRLREP